MDYLRACISFQRDIRNCNVLCFIETWLSPGIQDSAIQPGGRHCVPGNEHQPARWTRWWCGPASASSSCWCWRSRRSTTAVSCTSTLCSSSGLARRPRTSALHPRGHWHGHHKQRLPGVRFLPAVVEKMIPGTPGQHWEAQEELLPSDH